MDDLIKALQILSKYTNDKFPTHCEHDMLSVCVDPETVTEEDKEELNRLGFLCEDEEYFYSYRFGSC
jgi:DNA-binding protein YbaB